VDGRSRTGRILGQHELVPGVYERLVDDGTRRKLRSSPDSTAEERALLNAEAPDRLAAHVAERLRASLRRAGDLDEQVALTATQRLLELLDLADDEADRSLLLDVPASVLTRVGPPLLPGQSPPPFPLMPLSDSDLLVNAREESRLGEVRRCCASSRPPTGSTSSSRSSAGQASGSCSTRFAGSLSAVFRCGSSRPPTSAPPSAAPWTSCAASAPR
jgi:hypothetical protein